MTYEENAEIIEREINKRRGRWRLSALAWLDWLDIAQILRIHISKKIHLYLPERGAFPNWLNSVISSQIKNLLRNLYYNHSRPCLACSASEGENLCALFTVQCAACPLYAKWERTKKSANNIKLSLPLENHSQEISNRPNEQINFEESLKKLSTELKKILKPVEWKLYNLLYIDNLDEEQAGKLMNFKTTEAGRIDGYKQIKNLKKSIIAKAKVIIYSGDVDFI